MNVLQRSAPCGDPRSSRRIAAIPTRLAASPAVVYSTGSATALSRSPTSPLVAPIATVAITAPT